jgi:hypothetical protein
MPRIPRLPRRSFLRGACGTAVALPLLEIMLQRDSRARLGTAPGQDADGVALRYLVCFGGFSLGTDGDTDPNTYVPDATGLAYDLKPGLAPLADVQSDVTVVSGLRIPAPTSGIETVPGGRAGGDSFHFHTAPLLTGMRQTGGVFSTQVTGPSSDQVVADAIGGDTFFRSLTYRVQALYYSLGGNFVVDNPYNRDSLSYRAQGEGFEAIAPYVSPRQAYDALFTHFVPSDPTLAAQKAFELANRRSVLDLVDRRLGGLLPRLSTADQTRLQLHFDEIRELERRLDAPPPTEDGACALLPDPGADPALGSQFDDPGGYDINGGYSGEDERAALLVDLVHMAFTCDLTRAATLMFTMLQSFMNVEPVGGVAEQAHNLNHGGPKEAHTQFIAWHVGHFARLVAKLRDTPEMGGSVLDRCALVFLNEGGFGGDPFFGDQWSSHTTENMACLVAGGAGGLVRGEHLVAPQDRNHPANVLVTLMNAVGVETDTLGEVSGAMPGLAV